MSGRKSRNFDDMDLSLTGSQFSGLSGQQRRPGSASAKSKRPSSASGTRSATSNLLNGTIGSSQGTKPKKTHLRAGSHNGPLSTRSNNSDLSAGDSARDTTRSSARDTTRSSVRDTTGLSASRQTAKEAAALSIQKSKDDFLALFENSTHTPPRINKPKAATKASVNTHWQSSLSPRDRTMNSARSISTVDTDATTERETTHSQSFFTPPSARSTSTIDSEHLREVKARIRRSTSGESLTTQSSIYKTNSVELSPEGGAIRKTSSKEFRTSQESLSQLRNSRDLRVVTSLANNGNQNGNNLLHTPNSNNDVLNSHRLLSPRKAQTLNSIANNMTSQAMSPGTKTSLSDIENSYQNIKPKTPVNQITKSSKTNSETVGRNVAEDYIKVVNMSASKIQNWYRRILRRSRTAEAAMKRLLDQKRQQKQEQSQQDEQKKDLERQVEHDRKKTKEDRARQARQQAIQELHKKREEKRIENQRKAEEELVFLQSNGKLSKNPSNKNNIKRKVLKKTRPKSRSNEHLETDSEDDIERSRSPARPKSPKRPGTASSVGRKVDEIFQDNNITHRTLDVENDFGVEDAPPQTPSNAPSKTTTLDDLMSTLKLLEEDEKFPTPRIEIEEKNETRKSWFATGATSDEESAGYLSADKLEKLNKQKVPNSKSGLLSEGKLKSIMTFLDEVDTTERLDNIDQEINKVNEMLERPALLVPTGDELVQMERAAAQASEVTSTVLNQRMELDEKKRSIQMLQKALNQQRELTVRHAKETEKEMKKRLNVQKEEYEETIKRHLGFIDQLIDDKKTLGEKCESLVKELKQIEKKYSETMKNKEENHGIELQKIKEVHAAAEKLRREKWIDEKTKKIKEMTVKGLEPEIQRLISKHKTEIKKLKSIHEAELLEADERAGGRYIKMTEDLRDQLAEEKEAACSRERELARKTYEKQMQQEEEAFQQQRRRLYQEVQEEKERLAQQASRQRAEIDKLQRQLENSHCSAVDAMKSEYEKAREEQERRHESETRELKERLAIEKDAWEENYKKKQETWLLQKERELKEQVRKDRDKEIEMVIMRLEEDNVSAREECERAAENRIKRIRDKYENEMVELERSERTALEKYNAMKAQLTEVEGENKRLVVLDRQKDQEIRDIREMSEKLHGERDRVADIIRQEFADRIVATEEENKRLKNEMSEMKARHRLEKERAKSEVEIVQKAKEEEMEEVHKRVKQAIVKKEDVVQQLRQQYQAAVKRADHLEGLLEQQRKQLLGKR